MGRRLSSRGLLILAALVTLVAWQFEVGRIILWPFTLLATYAHEMGHGLTAVLVGGDFDFLKMHWDGSGLAHWSGDVGRIGRGLVAAGGLVGPSVFGALLLVLSKRPDRAPYILYVLGALMLLSVLLVVRSLVGVGLISLFGLGLIGLARYFRRGAPFVAQFIGVQLCIAVFRDVSYMFSAGAVVDGVQRLSDSAQIEQALFLPYWVWGAMTAAFSFIVLVLGLYLALREPKGGAPGPAAVQAV